MTGHLILMPKACVLAAIGPEVATFAFFYTSVEASVIVAAIAPDLNANPVLLLLQACDVGLFDQVEIGLDISSHVLTEDRKVCLAVLSPETFVYLVAWSWHSKHANTSWLIVDPEALKAAFIRP